MICPRWVAVKAQPIAVENHLPCFCNLAANCGEYYGSAGSSGY
jgi:hypothetical protein